MKKVSDLIRKHKTLIFVIIIAVITRFFSIGKIFFFGIDEEYQANLAFSLIKDFHILWIGVGSTIGFYLGPLWTYLTFIALFINHDVVVMGYIAGLFGVLTTFFVFFITKRVFSHRAAFVSSILYASLPLLVYYDQKFWNVSLVPLLTLLIYLSLQNFKKNGAYLILLFFCFGLIFHTHLALLPLAIYSFFYIAFNAKLLKKKYVISSIVIFLLIVSPLIMFDYFQKGNNILSFYKALKRNNHKSSNIEGHAESFFQSIGRVWYLSPYQSNADEINWGCTSTGNISSENNIEHIKHYQTVDTITSRDSPYLLLSIMSFIFLTVFLLSNSTWKNEHKRILASLIFIQIISFLFFPGGSYEYYFLGFFPLFLIIVGIVLDPLFNKFKYFIYSFLLIIVFLGIRSVLTTNGEFGLSTKKELISEVSSIILNKNYDLKEDGMCHIGSGWRYLFSTYYKTPLRSSSDAFFGWIYEHEISNDKSDYSVVMVESRTEPFLETNYSKADYTITKGGYKSYIFDNKK